MSSLEWMAWTVPTFVFIATILTIIAGYTVAAVVRPSVPRKGWLPIATARGDRLYIALIGLGLCMVVYIAVTDLPLGLGFVIGLCVWVVPVLRWG